MVDAVEYRYKNVLEWVSSNNCKNWADVNREKKSLKRSKNRSAQTFPLLIRNSKIQKELDKE